MNSIELLAKLRDAAQMIADAANQQLEKIAPPNSKYNEEDLKTVLGRSSRS